MSQEMIRIGGAHCGRDGSPYHPVKGLLSATNTALLLGAPLFLAGEPGCGKTDFAWYAAKALAQVQKKADYELAIPLQCYVHSDTRAKDLLYHYDTLARFADAHESQSQKEARDPRRYIELRALGLALMAKTQKVILIDEIDKAPRDLPNDLLRELDQGHFEIPDIPEHITGTYADRSDPDILLSRHMIRPNGTDGKARPGKTRLFRTALRTFGTRRSEQRRNPRCAEFRLRSGCGASEHLPPTAPAARTFRP